MRKETGEEPRLEERARRLDRDAYRMSAAPARVAVLISGRGSNMQSLLARQGDANRIVLVASDTPEAAGLAWLVTTVLIRHLGLA